MKKIKKLDVKDISDISERIGEPLFRLFKKKITREISYIYGNDYVPDLNDTVNITVITLGSVIANIYFLTRNISINLADSDIDIELFTKALNKVFATMVHSRLNETKKGNH